MPIMDGNVAALEMRKYEDTLESKVDSSMIIGMSANLGEHMTTLAEQAGMDAFLTKPFKLEDLIKSYEQIISGNLSSKTTDHENFSLKMKKLL